MKSEFNNSIANPILPDRGAGYDPGRVLFANSSRFLEAYFSEPLTNYAVGWRDPNNIEASLQFIAPSVPVGRRFEWKKANNAEEFLSEVIDDERAVGSDFKRVEYTASDVTDKTLNKGLTYIADLDTARAPNCQNDKVGNSRGASPRPSPRPRTPRSPGTPPPARTRTRTSRRICSRPPPPPASGPTAYSTATPRSTSEACPTKARAGLPPHSPTSPRWTSTSSPPGSWWTRS